MELPKETGKTGCMQGHVVVMLPPSSCNLTTTSKSLGSDSENQYIWFIEHETKHRPINLRRKIMGMRGLLGVRQEAVAEKLGISQLDEK